MSKLFYVQSTDSWIIEKLKDSNIDFDYDVANNFIKIEILNENDLAHLFLMDCPETYTKHEIEMIIYLRDIIKETNTL